MFRRARPARRSWNVAKTLVQIVVLWTLALAVVPWSITAVESSLASVGFEGKPLAGAVILILASGLGLWSGYVMAAEGEGTPFPLDAARRLVTKGPYAYVRNPMVMTALAQGMGVVLISGSWGVLVYFSIGIMIWAIVLRPLEEQDLLRQFGTLYEDYKAHVRNWIPRGRPYRPGPTK
jgi:protein-S-isoprenylcysteine O-methyltransferase Ste14